MSFLVPSDEERVYTSEGQFLPAGRAPVLQSDGRLDAHIAKYMATGGGLQIFVAPSNLSCVIHTHRTHNLHCLGGL